MERIRLVAMLLLSLLACAVLVACDDGGCDNDYSCEQGEFCDSRNGGPSGSAGYCVERQCRVKADCDSDEDCYDAKICIMYCDSMFACKLPQEERETCMYCPDWDVRCWPIRCGSI